MGNARQFGVEIDQFMGRSVADMAKLVRELTITAIDALVRLTPVDTGRARNGWQVGLGVRPTGTGFGGAGGAALALAAMGDRPQNVWIVNPVIYTEFLDQGSSRQAPQGMLRPTVDLLRARIERERGRTA